MFPAFSIILKVLQKIQHNKAQPIVVVPYRTPQNWFPVGMLIHHPLILTASLNILYLPTHPITPLPLYPKLKLLVAYISREILSLKMFLQQQYILLSSLRKSTSGRYDSVAKVA